MGGRSTPKELSGKGESTPSFRLSLQWVRGHWQRPLQLSLSPRWMSPFQGPFMPWQGCQFSFGFCFLAPWIQQSPRSTRAAVTP